MLTRLFVGALGASLLATRSVALPTPQVDDAREVRVAAVGWVVEAFVAKQSSMKVTIACVAGGESRTFSGSLAPMSVKWDLDSATMSSLTHLPLPIRPRAGCKSAAEFPGRILDAKTGLQAVAITVAVPEFYGPDRASILVEAEISGLGGRGYQCIASRRGEVWGIDSCVTTWIS